MSDPKPLIDPVVFPSLKEKIEEETKVKDALTQIVQKLEGVDSYARGLLTRVHSTPRKNCELTHSPFPWQICVSAHPEGLFVLRRCCAVA